MAYTPWLTSDDLIASIKRKISFPVYQSTFTEQELLDFATEEMMISQVPSVLSFHEEYFVTTLEVTLREGKRRYPIPERAIGMKLRDLFVKDSNGNLLEMTRVAQDDRAFFQRQPGTNQTISKYYLEGNDVVLAIDEESVPTDGSALVFVYYIRPSRLVKNERAAVIEAFAKTLTVANASVVSGDTVTIDDTTLTAGTDFAIGATSNETATNLAAAITTADIVESATVATGTAVVTLNYRDLETDIESSNSSGIAVQETQSIVFTDDVPANIENGATIDFLQTRPGHKIRKIDVELGDNVVSGDTVTFDEDDVPEDLIVGDYICLANECIIPYIPTDLHTALAERTCARILAAIGDVQGLAATNEKIAEIEIRQGSILDNRVEGSTRKVRARNSLIALGKMGRRRF
jgi:hypothetical protein